MRLLPWKCCLIPVHSGARLLICHGSSLTHDTAGSGLLWSVRWNESIGADQAISENTQRLWWRQRNAPMTGDIYGKEDCDRQLVKTNSLSLRGGLQYWCCVCKTGNCKVSLCQYSAACSVMFEFFERGNIADPSVETGKHQEKALFDIH